MKKQRCLSNSEAKSLGLELRTPQKGKKMARYYVSNKDYKKILLSRNDETETKEVLSKENVKPFVLSAWNKKGYMMDIEEYCNHYKLPRKDVKSYKLVSHTGTPFYNIQFKENIETIEGFDFDLFEQLIQNNIQPIEKEYLSFRNTETFDRLIYTDVHIGMECNKDGFALYGLEWNEEKINDRLNVLVSETINNKKSSTLYVDELGDFLDGWDAQTTRKGHALPQNMDNQKAFDTAVNFKVSLVDNLINYYNEITLNNICEDNHAGSFGYVVNSAVKTILEIKYKGKVKVNNMRKFINHYFVGSHCFILSHGKDSKNLKFGFKPVLDTKQSEKIDQYCKVNNIYKQAEFIEFSKGDSHQMIMDYTTSNDFDYCNYPAFSPSSEWVQTNFSKGRSGFVFSTIELNENKKQLIPYWF